jgi:hypothetical protein
MEIHSGLVDILQPRQVILPMLYCSNLARIERKFSYSLFLSQNSLSSYVTTLDFTDICKLSCILHTGQHDHVHNNQSSAVEAWHVNLVFTHIELV